MTDIVRRLRAPAYWFSGSDEGHEGENDAPLEAADEIERLRAALREIEDLAFYEVDGDKLLPRRLARAALATEPAQEDRT